MKNIRFSILLSFVLMMALCPAAYSALRTTPEKHEEYMKNESYKDTFEQFMAWLDEAKEKLEPDDYIALARDSDVVITASVNEDTKSASEAESYEAAYLIRCGQIREEIRCDWLRKNAVDAQGFYRLKSDDSNKFIGYMTLEKWEEDDVYRVGIFVTMRKEPYNEGSFDTTGELSDGKITLPYIDDENAVVVTLDGETAKVTTSQSFKESGEFGADVILDGEYLREKITTTSVFVMYDLSEFEFSVNVPDFLAIMSGGKQVTNNNHVSNQNQLGITYRYEKWADEIHDYLETLTKIGFVMYDSNDGDTFWEKGNACVAVTRTGSNVIEVSVLYQDGPYI